MSLILYSANNWIKRPGKGRKPPNYMAEEKTVWGAKQNADGPVTRRPWYIGRNWHMVQVGALGGKGVVVWFHILKFSTDFRLKIGPLWFNKRAPSRAPIFFFLPPLDSSRSLESTR